MLISPNEASIMKIALVQFLLVVCLCAVSAVPVPDPAPEPAPIPEPEPLPEPNADPEPQLLGSLGIFLVTVIKALGWLLGSLLG